jgi:hypothetical protein
MMGMNGKKKGIAALILEANHKGEGDSKEGSGEGGYTDAKKESMYMAMDKFMSALKEGDGKSASESMASWCDMHGSMSSPDDKEYKAHGSHNSEGGGEY